MPYTEQIQTLTFPNDRSNENYKLLSKVLEDSKPLIIIEDQKLININYHTKTLTYNNKDFQLLNIKIEPNVTTFDIAIENKVVGYILIPSSDWKINKYRTNFAK